MIQIGSLAAFSLPPIHLICYTVSLSFPTEKGGRSASEDRLSFPCRSSSGSWNTIWTDPLLQGDYCPGLGKRKRKFKANPVSEKWDMWKLKGTWVECWQSLLVFFKSNLLLGTWATPVHSLSNVVWYRIVQRSQRSRLFWSSPIDSTGSLIMLHMRGFWIGETTLFNQSAPLAQLVCLWVHLLKLCVSLCAGVYLSHKHARM